MALKKNKNILIIETSNPRSILYKKAVNLYSQPDIIDELLYYGISIVTSVNKSVSGQVLRFIDMNGCSSNIYIKTTPLEFLEFLRLTMKIKKDKRYIKRIPSFYEKTKYGYKDIKKASETINKIKKKPLNEQLQIMDILIKRAIRHPKRTQNMLTAVKTFNEYINNKKKETIFPLLPFELVKHFIKLAEFYQIGLVARGIVNSYITDKRFLDIYPTISDIKELKNVHINKNNFTSWYLFRHRILFKKMKKIRQWFHTSGKLRGLPTKEHVIFILWGYSPFLEKLKKIKRRKEIVKKTQVK